MLNVILVALLQAASGAPADPPSTTTPPAVEPKKDVQMVCHWERETGSNLKQTKVCKPKGQKDDDQDTALQRALNRSGDRVIPPPKFGN